MKTVTNNFKEEIRKLGREIDFKIFLYANDKLITQNNNFIITQDNLNLVVEQFNQEEIEYTINSDEIYNVSVVNRGELLSTMMKEVDFEVSKELKVGDVISCEFGLKVGNSYEYVDYGKYMIYEKEFNEDTKTYSYVAYDRMLLTMREIPNPSNFESKNILSVIQEICTITNLEFNGTSQTALTYPNLNKVINQGTFTDLVMTYRDMLDMICQALGLSMVVEDNELVLKDINEKERTLVGKNSLYLENVIEGNALGYSVDGVCEQDGTPTPSSPQEIKTIPSIINLLNYETSVNGSIPTNSTSETLNSDSHAITSAWIPCKPNTTYTISGGKNRNRWQTKASDGTISYFASDSATITTNSTAKYLRCYYYYASSSIDPQSIQNVQIEEGTIIHEYVPYGYWSRVKITGKNLFSGYEVGYINSSDGNDETNNNCHRSFYIPVKPNTTYTTSTLITRFVEYNKNKGFIQCLFNTSNSITTTENTYYLRLGFNNTISTSDLDVEMLEEGTTATQYEQYKENEVLIDMSKENLFDSSNANTLNAYINASGVIKSDTVAGTLYISCKPNTTYTICKAVQETLANNRFRVGCTSSTPNTEVTLSKYYNLSNGTNITSYVFETNSTATYLVVNFYGGSSQIEYQNVFNSIKIFESNNPTPYYEICEAGDNKDRLVIDSTGNCVINKKIGKVVLNGSEPVYKGGTTLNQYFSAAVLTNYIKPVDNNQNVLHFSSHFINKAPNELSGGSVIGSAIRRDNSIGFAFGLDSEINTVALCKTWLSNNKPEFYYQMETPETITLPNTKIPLFEGINHITLIDNLETDTSVVYNSSDLAVEEIDETYLNDTNVSFGKKYGPINSVVLSRSEDYDTIYRRDDESIEKNGLCEYKIKDNPILLYNDREEYIDEIFNQLKGIEYYPNDYLSKGITFLDWLDFYNVKIGDNTYKCLMLNDEIKVEQGLEESVYSEIPEETVTDYKTSSKTDKEVSFIVDKQKGQISAKVNKGDVINEINLDETGASINAEKISLAGKTIEMTSDNINIDSTNFKVDKDGNMVANNVTLNSGTFKGDVNTSQNCYVGDNLYVGQNQSSSYSSVKKIKFSDNVEIGKLKIGNTEALSLYSPFLNLNGKEGTNIHYEYNNTQYTNGTLSRNMFYLSCLEDGVYILGDQNGISFSQQPYWPSDKRLKQEIKNIDTSWIDELKIKEFEYIKLPNKKQIGLIAQDYIDKDYSKYFLNENEKGYYGISYGNITNALIQYCQEMKKEINSLKEEIKQLKEENK